MLDVYQKYKNITKLELIYKNQVDDISLINAYVAEVKEKYIVICATLSENEFVDIPLDARVQLYSYTEEGIFHSDSKVLKIKTSDDLIMFVLSYPKTKKHYQRREYFRATIQIPVKVVITTNFLEGKFHTINAISRDVCGKGVSFYTDYKIEDYEDLVVTLQFPDKNIETSAKIVYVKEEEMIDGFRYLYAFSFLDIKGKNIDFIVKKCFIHQIRTKNRD